MAFTGTGRGGGACRRAERRRRRDGDGDGAVSRLPAVAVEKRCSQSQVCTHTGTMQAFVPLALALVAVTGENYSCNFFVSVAWVRAKFAKQLSASLNQV